MLSAADPSVNGVNTTDDEGWAPIHSAASIGNLKIMQILLERGTLIKSHITLQVRYFVEILLSDHNFLILYNCNCLYNRG